ncbi:MAG: hypothetical protein KDD82_28800, partial [Planctomycetes bacterium]|nr:hypothetical protein [Planctomycetota bacterium]
MLSSLERLGRHLPRGLVDRTLGSEGVAKLRARLLAAGDKRLDVCTAQLAHLLHLCQGASPRPPRPRSELLGLTP